MFRKSLSILVLLASAAAGLPALAQTTQNKDQQEEVVRVGSSEVVLDAVVRDKKGRVVKDLSPSDFEVFEDGVRQDVTSFRLVTRGGAASDGGVRAGAVTAAASPDAAVATGRGVERVGAVALVFDRLSPESRVRARQAALAYLGGGLTPDDLVGVFGIDLSLRVYQPFTNNEQLVRRAVEGAGSQNSAPNVSRAQEIADAAQNTSQLESAADQTQAGAGQGTSDASGMAATGGTMMDLAAAEMTQRSLETFDMLERNQQGYATTNALLAVISSLARLPGRKTIVLFSDGIAIPSDVESTFRTVISNANRANVSIYSVDAAGLRALSADQAAGRALSTLGQQRVRQAGSLNDPGTPMMRDLERNEDLMRSNPDSGLGQLAEQTGGFLVSNTNDPGVRLRAAGEDMHTYYTLSYVPKNQTYDGRFRQVSVKLTRPGLEVQTRKGYYAINADYASPVLDYEAPALALLGGGHTVDSFAVRAAAFSFPEPAKPGLLPVVVEVPAGSVSFNVDAEKKTYYTDFAVVALVKDESQRVVRKLSNRYLLSGPLDRLDAAKRGAILFYREAELPPGRYTVAAAVYDALTARSGVATGAPVVVPRDDASVPRLASVVIIDRAERTNASGKQSDTPFRFGEMLVYPNLGQPLRKSSTKELALMLTVYAARGEKAAPKLTLEIAQGGRTLGKGALELPAPDADGRIQYASTIPTEKLQPGDYQLVVTVSDSHGTSTRVEHFTIQP
ncbi:MAG TPA: VWA domain-containing protein [Pyrinomonadaceae bacterium]|nr:VWA domain-containing protein [Pyrinomonadaceae bacterium]